MRTGPRVVVQPAAVPVLRDDGVLRLAVLRVVPLVLPVVPREPNYGLGVAHVTVLLFSGVAGVEVSLKVFWMAHDTVAVVLFLWQRAEGAVVEVMGWGSVVERERLVRTRICADVSEAAGGRRAAAAPRAPVRPPRGAVTA